MEVANDLIDSAFVELPEQLLRHASNAEGPAASGAHVASGESPSLVWETSVPPTGITIKRLRTSTEPIFIEHAAITTARSTTTTERSRSIWNSLWPIHTGPNARRCSPTVIPLRVQSIAKLRVPAVRSCGGDHDFGTGDSWRRYHDEHQTK